MRTPGLDPLVGPGGPAVALAGPTGAGAAVADGCALISKSKLSHDLGLKRIFERFKGGQSYPAQTDGRVSSECSIAAERRGGDHPEAGPAEAGRSQRRRALRADVHVGSGARRVPLDDGGGFANALLAIGHAGYNVLVKLGHGHTFRWGTSASHR